jgi:hypothetical protein
MTVLSYLSYNFFRAAVDRFFPYFPEIIREKPENNEKTVIIPAARV